MEVKIYNDKNEKSERVPCENAEVNLPSSSILLNEPLDIVMIQNPLEELAESNLCLIHIKNTIRNSFFNCYVNCCFGYSIIYNTFLNTPKGIKYLFQSNASIIPDIYSCTFKDNIKLEARFTTLLKSNSEEISLDSGTQFTEMLKREKFCCCDKEEILMPVNIISENRIAGIVKIHGLAKKNCCSNNACLPFAICCLPNYLCLTCCCPFCSFQCGDCSNSEKKSNDNFCKNCCNFCNSDSDKKICDCCNSDKKCPCFDENRCCCGLCEKSSFPCCDDRRCCCGLCEKSSFPCCDDRRCCCGLCEKSKGPSLCCCCCCCFNCKSNDNKDIKCCWNRLSYHCEILSPESQLKYHIYLISHNCGNKCLRRRLGLNFIIADINNNPIMKSSILGRNNKNFGKFFEDSYSYEINFPEDAEPDYKLTLLHAIYALDALCIY